MILALDFDRTLFDTDTDIAALTRAGHEALIGDPRAHDAVDPAPYLYTDTIPFLQAHRREQIYIVSAVTARYGPHSAEYQHDKIVRTGVAALVHEVVLTGDSKVDALRALAQRHAPEQVMFIDDRADVIADACEGVAGLICVYMERAGARRMSDTVIPSGVPTVTSLAELELLCTHYA